MPDTGTSFADAAERFANIARQIKAEQRMRTGAMIPPAAPEPVASHPQAAWNRKHAAIAVRPGRPIATPKPFLGASQSRDTEIAIPPAPPVDSGPIGLAIGKPVRRKSWLRRLVRGG